MAKHPFSPELEEGGLVGISFLDFGGLAFSLSFGKPMMKGLLGPQEAQSDIHNGKNFEKKSQGSFSVPALQPALTGTGYLDALAHINGYEVL